MPSPFSLVRFRQALAAALLAVALATAVAAQDLGWFRGGRFRGPDRILDIMHVTAQGVIAGANMILVDFHPNPEVALVDGPQALRLEELSKFLEDVRIVRKAFEDRLALFAVEDKSASLELAGRT